MVLGQDIVKEYKDGIPEAARKQTPAALRSFAETHGLKYQVPQSWTVEGMAQLLRRSPLMVCGTMIVGHCVVIAAMSGDGTAKGTKIRVLDPRGRAYWITYGEFMRKYPEATTCIMHR